MENRIDNSNREKQAFNNELASNRSSDNENEDDEEEEVDINELKAQLKLLCQERGTEHPITLEMYVKLGLRLFDTEIYDEAEELFRKAWNGRRSVFGRKELPTLRVEVNLACSLSKLQRYEDAAECFREALAGFESMEGCTDYDLLDILEGLAEQYKETEVFYRRILTAYQTYEGEDHINSLNTLMKLTRLYNDQALYTDADICCSSAYQALVRTLGEDDPFTQETMETLAQIKLKLGRNEDAEKIYTKMLNYQRNVLGEHHEQTIQTLSKVAKIVLDKGDKLEAERLYRQAIQEFENSESFGPTHPQTLDLVHKLGSILLDSESLVEAEALLRRSYFHRKEIFGDVHEETLESATSLGRVLHVMSRWKHLPNFSERLLESDMLLSSAIAGYQTLHGDNDDLTIQARKSYADFLIDQSRYKEAYNHYKIILKLTQERYGLNHQLTAKAAYRLGECYMHGKKFKQASEAFHQAHVSYLNIYGNSASKKFRSIIDDAFNLWQYTTKRSQLQN